MLATHDLDTLDLLADRCLVFSEEHRIVGEGTSADVLADRHLLLDVNLIHEHSHLHGTEIHSHLHGLDHHGETFHTPRAIRVESNPTTI